MKGDSNNKSCSFCGNKNFRQNEVEYIYRQGQNFFIVNKVPCEECAFCSEKYYKASVLKKIEQEFKKIYSNGKKNVKKISVPMEAFENI